MQASATAPDFSQLRHSSSKATEPDVTAAGDAEPDRSVRAEDIRVSSRRPRPNLPVQR